MPFFWRVRLVILSLVVVVLTCFGAYWGVLYAVRSNEAAPFKAHMAEYLAPTKPADKAGGVRGKFVVLDKNTQELDWEVFFGLPADLRASSPEQVGAAVWLEYGRKKEDNFVYGKDRLPAYRQTCKVTVIDQAERAVIAVTSLNGGDPPSEIDDSAKEGVGPKPTAGVIAYLKNLPRR